MISGSNASSQSHMLKHIRSVHPFLNGLNLTEVYESAIQNDLLQYEQYHVTNCYKFGVLYAKEGQSENEIFSNGTNHVDGNNIVVEVSPEYEDFLFTLGEKVKLEGFDAFRGGLDVKRTDFVYGSHNIDNSTGTHSLYTKWNDFQIMVRLYNRTLISVVSRSFMVATSSGRYTTCT